MSKSYARWIQESYAKRPSWALQASLSEWAEYLQSEDAKEGMCYKAQWNKIESKLKRDDLSL